MEAAKPYQALLPASKVPLRRGPLAGDSTLKRKHGHLTKVACNSCRQRKAACDGERPKCNSCQSRDIECVYITADKSETPSMALKRENDQLRERSDALDEIIDLLRKLPEESAQLVLQKIRNTSDTAAVIREFKGENILLQLPEPAPPISMFPVLQGNIDPATIARYPLVYPPSPETSPDEQLFSAIPPLRPLKVARLANTHITGFNTENTLDTPWRTPVEGFPWNHKGMPGASNAPFDPGLASAVHYSDNRLADLDIARWTGVHVSNEDAAGAVSLFLETDHLILGLFDAKEFVSSFVDCRPEFCSPFLVSSLLAFASQAYASQDSGAFARSYEFENEAEKLWANDKMPDSMTAIAGMVLLFLSIGSHGQDDRAAKFIIGASDMATRMKVFGIVDALARKNNSAAASDNGSPPMMNALNSPHG